MAYETIKRCRICGKGEFNSILHLGTQALTGVFPRSPEEKIEAGPVELIKCDESTGGCGLVQLRQSYSPDAMYGENYGYRSGLNASMVRHLQRRVKEACNIAQPQPGDVILDIGSNDSTTLRAYRPGNLKLVGMDPTGRKFAQFYPEHIKLIPDYFNAETFTRHLAGAKARIVTSIAMFYDLESPQGFMDEVHRILDDEGIWIFEQSYLPSMLDTNGYDTICHEHLSYYALQQIKWMTDRAGFKILDVEVNDVNGGSFCVTVAKDSSSYTADVDAVECLLAKEEEIGINTLDPFEAFRDRVLLHREQLRSFCDEAASRGETVYGYGASTKGNVLLQFCDITRESIPAIAEINSDKFGAFTPHTLIPICSEAEVRSLQPDYLLVLPWHFRRGIVERETAYLARGGKLVFPLPHVDVETYAETLCYAA
jgi:hypothetical protein